MLVKDKLTDISFVIYDIATQIPLQKPGNELLECAINTVILPFLEADIFTRWQIHYEKDLLEVGKDYFETTAYTRGDTYTTDSIMYRGVIRDTKYGNYHRIFIKIPVNKEIIKQAIILQKIYGGIDLNLYNIQYTPSLTIKSE